MPPVLADFLAATEPPANRSLGEWILNDLPSLKQQLPTGYACSSLFTATSGQPLPPIEYWPAEISQDDNLPDDLVQYLTRALATLPAANQQVPFWLFQTIQRTMFRAFTSEVQPKEVGVTRFLNKIIDIVRELHDALCQTTPMIVTEQEVDPHTAYKMDISIQTTAKVQWAIEVTRADLLNGLDFWIDDLNTDVQKIRPRPPISGAASIVFKLACWMRGLGVEFGLLCDGQHYFIFRMYQAGEENQFAMSRSIDLVSTDYSLVRILLAVSLADCHGNTELLIPTSPKKPLNVDSAAKDTLPRSSLELRADANETSRKSAPPRRQNKLQSKNASAHATFSLEKALLTARKLRLSLSTGTGREQVTYAERDLRRINYSNNSASKNLSRGPNGQFQRKIEQPPLVECALSDWFAASETSHCFRLEDSGLIFKYATNAKLKHQQFGLLRTEARIYERSLAHLCGNALPVFYGCFVDHEVDVLVMSDVGSAVRHFSDLDAEQKCAIFSAKVCLKLPRKRLYQIMENVHARGVLHGDFASRNVTVDLEGQVHLIDFSHGAEDVLCPGVSCRELRDVRRMLELDEIV